VAVLPLAHLLHGFAAQNERRPDLQPAPVCVIIPVTDRIKGGSPGNWAGGIGG
jgi:hypothetical protein